MCNMKEASIDIQREERLGEESESGKQEGRMEGRKAGKRRWVKDIKTEYLNPNSDSIVRCTFFFLCHATWAAGSYFSDPTELIPTVVETKNLNH